MNKRISIAIADTSVIIRNGLMTVLKQLSAPQIDIAEISDVERLKAQLARIKPQILIVNPLLPGIISLRDIKMESGCKNLKIIALRCDLNDNPLFGVCDETISLYDSAEQISEKLSKFCRVKEESDNSRQEISNREKDIIVQVVKGLTNKEIADTLCLSTHTVITHRRNIANKLQIHSPAGLTIYAIVNKLVDIDDVKSTIRSDF